MVSDFLGHFEATDFPTAPADFNGFVIPTNPAFAESIIKTQSGLAVLALKWGDDGKLGVNNPLNEYVSFSFPTSPNTYKEGSDYTAKGYPGNQPSSPGFDSFSDDQEAAAQHALHRYTEVADIKFVDKGNGNAALRYANTANLASVAQTSDPGYGEAYQPGPAAESGNFVAKTSQGDVWILNTYPGTNGNPGSPPPWAPGSQGHYLILHETGHALGLAHPGSGIESIDKTVMSIKPLGGSESGKTFYPTTPMPYDIAALQFIYGPNWEHNKDDTTYKFDGKTPFFETIWDAGGNDTIDFRDAEFPATINLNNGELSWIDDPNGTYRVAIAFARTDDPKDDPATPENEARNDTIENAKGGSGNDTIHGNDAANSLAGNAGNDDLFGEDGNDWLDGGSDLDRLYGGNGRDTIKGGPGNDEALGGDGNDWITMGDGNDWARGGAGNDTVDGGSGENKLYGDAGDDALVGQPTDDRLYGSYRHPDPRGDPRPDGDDVFKIVGDDIPPYVTGQNNTILYTFGHPKDTRGHYGNADKIDLSAFDGGGWKLIHSGDALKPGTIKVTNHDINLWKVDGYAVSQLVGKDKDGDYFQLFIDDGPANGWDYRVKDFIGVTSDFPDLA